MEIREIREADVDRIVAITAAAWSDLSIHQRLEDRHGVTGNTAWRQRKAESVRSFCMEKPSNVIVAIEDGIITGYASFSIDAESGIGHVLNNAVESAFQGRGIASAMNRWIIQHFREKGLRVARVSTLASNVAAQKVYESQGFEELARTIHYSMSL